MSDPKQSSEAEKATFLRFSGDLRDTPGSRLGAEVGDLVSRVSPVFVLFPEGTVGSSPPFPSGGHDYHPRAVSGYLASVRLVPLSLASWPRMILAAFGYALLTALVFGVGIVAAQHFEFPFADSLRRQANLVGGPDDLVRQMAIWTVLGAMPYLVLLALWLSRERKSEDALRNQLANAQKTQLAGYAFRGGMRPGAASSRAAWERYCKWVDATAGGTSHERVVYLRVIRDEAEAPFALQFWMFYHFNDWVNKHESDWECVTMFFRPGATRVGQSTAALTPLAAAYSVHLGSYWRRWADVRKTRDAGHCHPLVYVARGSHANYFQPRAEGYIASWAVPNPLGQDLRVRTGGRRPRAEYRDYVPSVVAHALTDVPPDSILPYRIEVMPAALDAISPTGDAVIWTRWWWLTYRGKWGTQGHGAEWAIDGPPHQHARWYTPFAWVSEDGQADASWEEVFGDRAPVATCHETTASEDDHMRLATADSAPGAGS